MKKRKFDYDQLARIAAQSENLDHFLQLSHIAAGSYSYFYQRDAQFREALSKAPWRRGSEIPRKTSDAQIVRKGLIANFTENQFHEYGRNGLNQSRIAENLGLPAMAISTAFKNRPELREAYQKGLKKVALDTPEPAPVADRSDLRPELLPFIVSKPRNVKTIAEIAGIDKVRTYIVLSELVASGAVVKVNNEEYGTGYFLRGEN